MSDVLGRDAALGLLTTLYRRWTRAVADGRSPPAVRFNATRQNPAAYYDPRLGATGRDALHAVLAEAAASGAVHARWGRGPYANELSRLEVVDGEALAVWLGETPPLRQAAALEAQLEPVLKRAPRWLASAFDDGLRELGRGDGWLGLQADRPADILDLARLAAALASDQARGRDRRTFSEAVTGDSKALERHRGRLVRLLRGELDLPPDPNPDQVLARFGLTRHPQPVLLRGPLRLALGTNWVDLGPVRPWLGVPPDAVRAVEITGAAGYLLTVENLTSFQRHAREVADSGIVLFTAGFPDPAWRSFLRALEVVLPPELSCWHWGDCDVGGLRIFQAVAECLPGRVLHPHLMEPRPTGTPFSPRERTLLARITQEGGAGASVARALLDCGRRSEQEGRNPRTPVGDGGPASLFPSQGG